MRQRAPGRTRDVDPDDFRATLGEHLEELRGRLVRVLGVFAVMLVLGWFLAMPVYDALNSMALAGIPKGLDYKEPFNNITQPFMLQLRMAASIGFAITFPILVWEVWGFVKPGLRPSERRPIRFLAPFSTLLFFVGCFLGWLSVPAAFTWFAGFFASFPGTSLYQEPGTLVFLIVKLVLAFGLGFQLPVVTFLLTKLGLISADMVMRYWRQAVVAILTFSAALTPSGDPFTMMILALPLIVLFFGSVLAVKLTDRGQGRDPALDALD